LVIYKGKDCRFRVNGSQPLVPTTHGSAPVLAVAQASEGQVSGPSNGTATRVSDMVDRVRGWVIRSTVFARVRAFFRTMRDALIGAEDARPARDAGDARVAVDAVLLPVARIEGPVVPLKVAALLSPNDRGCLR
jgi:hypothetical protein